MPDGGIGCGGGGPLVVQIGNHSEWGFQWDSPLTEVPSTRGEEERESPFSVLSELEPLWLWWSAVAIDAALDEVVEEAEGLAFSLKSVMMTVRSPTVTSRCWALLRSMFFNLGLQERERGERGMEGGEQELIPVNKWGKNKQTNNTGLKYARKVHTQI